MLKQNWLLLGIALVFSLALTSCGSKEDATTDVPTPEAPDTTPDISFEPAPEPEADERVPDISRAVSLTLNDLTNFTGLQDIAKNVFVPLVGDPLLSMDLVLDRDSGVTGSILVAFEDQAGFWGAQVPLFEGTGTIRNTHFQAVFADDELVFTVVGSIQGDNLSGKVSYRIRQDGDVACKAVTISCDPVLVDPGSGFFFNPPPPPAECGQPIDTVTPCLSYANPSLSVVKELGSFSGSFSNWVR